MAPVAVPQGLVCLMMAQTGSVNSWAKIPCRLQIDDVVVAELLALELAAVGHALAAAVGVERRLLVRVLAIAEIEGLVELEAQRLRKAGAVADLADVEVCGVVHGDLGERVGDGGVVGGGGGKGLLRQAPLGLERKLAGVLLQLRGDGVVVGSRGYDGHVLEVLGRRAHHRRSADVDVFDDLLKVHAGLAGRLFKGVQIHHQHVDRLDAVLLDGGDVGRVGAHVQDASVNLGMQGLDPAIEHLREAGQVADIAHAQARVAQHAGGTAGGDQFHALGGKPPGKFDQSCFVGDAQDGTFDLRHDFLAYDEPCRKVREGRPHMRMRLRCGELRYQRIATPAAERVSVSRAIRFGPRRPRDGTGLDVFAGARLEPHLPALHHYSVLDGLAVELAANLIGLDLHEGGEGVEGAERLPGSLAGAHHGFIERHHLDDIVGEEEKALRLAIGLRRWRDFGASR